MKRMKKHIRYLKLAQHIATWSKCASRKVGSCIVKDDIVISTGVNGTPRKYQNCNEGGCERCNDVSVESGIDLHLCKCEHSERNAIYNAAYCGHPTKNSILYLTHSPCLDCAKGIIQSGIKEVYFVEEYPKFLEDVENLFSKTSVKIQQIKIK